MTEYQLRAVIATLSFTVGLFVGFILWHKSTGSRTLTALQITAIGMFFGYLGMTAISSDVHYSDLVAVSILSIVGGESIGSAIANYLEGRKQ